MNDPGIKDCQRAWLFWEENQLQVFAGRASTATTDNKDWYRLQILLNIYLQFECASMGESGRLIA